jgi:hypothetical protein
MKLFSTAALALSLVFSASTYAGYENGTFTVSSLRVASDGTYVTFNPAPPKCKEKILNEDKTYYRSHARILNTSAGYDSMYSSLLAAYSSGATFKYIFFAGTESADGCNSPGNLFQLTALEFSAK